MKLLRFALAVVLLASVTGLAYVAQQIEGAGVDQIAAAQAFLASLTPEQKSQATFAFDSKERTNWNFIPLQDKERKTTRKGLPLEAMSAEQKQKAIALLKAGTSTTGAETAQLIMSLEGILREAEKDKGAMVRNPQWYFVSVFGTPGKTGQWGWRIEGHHLSINVTLDGTQVVSSTPMFFGANPAEVKTGDKKGVRVLADAEGLANKLFNTFDAEQKKIAVQTKHFPEPKEKHVTPNVGAPVGLPLGKMTAAQKELAIEILSHYCARLPRDVGLAEMKAAKDAGVDGIHFAYAGVVEAGQKRSYRLQGPTFVIEFLNVQGDSHGNPANHIHTSLRRIKGDFGIQ